MLLNEVMDVVLDELGHFEGGAWYGDHKYGTGHTLAVDRPTRGL